MPSLNHFIFSLVPAEASDTSVKLTQYSLKSLNVNLICFQNFSTLCLFLAKMKLSARKTCLLAFLAFVGLAMSAQMPNSLHGDTSEYLRLLAGIKSGNVTLTGQNVSAAIPWVYTSQGIKFQEKLKQGKMIIKFSLSRCQHINISKVKYSLFLIEGVCTK